MYPIPEMILMSETKGQINRYTCTNCRKSIVTVNLVDGVTPAILSCKVTEGCSGQMMSSWYNCNQGLIPTHEWYKPKDDAEIQADVLSEMKVHGLDTSDQEEVNMLFNMTRDHVNQGGLLLRKKENPLIAHIKSFKVGDRIRVRSNNDLIKRGLADKEGTVVHIQELGVYRRIEVELDEPKGRVIQIEVREMFKIYPGMRHP